MTGPGVTITRHHKARGAFAAHKINPLTSELHDLVKAMEAKYNGVLHRQQLDSGVRVALERANGDRLAASGGDTEEALANLHTRLEAWPTDA